MSHNISVLFSRLTSSFQTHASVVNLDVLAMHTGGTMELTMAGVPVAVRPTHGLGVTLTPVDAHTHTDLVVTETSNTTVGIGLAYGCVNRIENSSVVFCCYFHK